jgi:two-component system, NarL family, response regulator LiaR
MSPTTKIECRTEADPALNASHVGNDDRPRDGQPASRSIKLLISDHAPTRRGIRMALGPEVTVCAETDKVEDAIRAAKREQPDVALIGCEIFADWRGAVRGICRAAPDCAVVVLAQFGNADDMLECVRAGAVGYAPGPLDADRLRRIFRAVTDDEAVVPRGMVIELLSELRGGASAVLTGRETQVLGMLRRGHSTAWIAERLRITPVTVRRHISELVHKLGVESRSDLIDQGAGLSVVPVAAIERPRG